MRGHRYLLYINCNKSKLQLTKVSNQSSSAVDTFIYLAATVHHTKEAELAKKAITTQTIERRTSGLILVINYCCFSGWKTCYILPQKKHFKGANKSRTVKSAYKSGSSITGRWQECTISGHNSSRTWSTTFCERKVPSHKDPETVESD